MFRVVFPSTHWNRCHRVDRQLLAFNSNLGNADNFHCAAYDLLEDIEKHQESGGNQ